MKTRLISSSYAKEKHFDAVQLWHVRPSEREIVHHLANRDTAMHLLGLMVYTLSISITKMNRRD
jgi:hypothetical protein